MNLIVSNRYRDSYYRTIKTFSYTMVMENFSLKSIRYVQEFLLWEVSPHQILWEVFLYQISWEVSPNRILQEVSPNRILWEVSPNQILWEVFLYRMLWELSPNLTESLHASNLMGSVCASNLSEVSLYRIFWQCLRIELSFSIIQISRMYTKCRPQILCWKFGKFLADR